YSSGQGRCVDGSRGTGDVPPPPGVVSGRRGLVEFFSTRAEMSDTWDIVILGSGIAGLAGALAAHEFGLRAVVLEKASTLGGGTVHSYGLIWVGQNHLAQAVGYNDTRDEVIAYLRFLGGGTLDGDRMSTFVDRSPEALEFFERCGVRFHMIRGLTDHYC